jgi:hypothetical protein
VGALSHFKVRQSSAVSLLGKREGPLAKAKSRLFPQQSAAGAVGAIKAASIAGNIPKESGALPQPCRRPKR